MISHKAQPNNHSVSDQNLIPCLSWSKAKEPLCWSAHSSVPSFCLSLAFLPIQQCRFVFICCIIHKSYTVPHWKSTHLSTPPSRPLSISAFVSFCIHHELSFWLTQDKLNWFTRAEHSRGHRKTFSPLEQTWPIVSFPLVLWIKCVFGWDQGRSTNAWKHACKFLKYPSVLQAGSPLCLLMHFYDPTTHSLCCLSTCICFSKSRWFPSFFQCTLMRTS